MQIAEDRLEPAHDFAFQRDVHAKHAMSRWMLRPHRDFEQLALESRAHRRRRSLDRFQRLDRCVHSIDQLE